MSRSNIFKICLTALKANSTFINHQPEVSIQPFIHNFVSHETFKISLSFGQMFTSVRRCAEPRTQLRRVKVKVTVTVNRI